MSLQRRSTDKTTWQQNSKEPVSRQNVLFGSVGLLGQDTYMDALIQETVHDVVDGLGAEYSTVFELLPKEDLALFCASQSCRNGEVGGRTIGMGLRSHAHYLSPAVYTLLANEQTFVEALRDQAQLEGCSLRREHTVTSSVTIKIWAQGGRFGMVGVNTPEQRSLTDGEKSWLIDVRTTWDTPSRTPAGRPVPAAGLTVHFQARTPASEGLRIARKGEPTCTPLKTAATTASAGRALADVRVPG